jgi:ABC-2 type transport system ATP-binding protein
MSAHAVEGRSVQRTYGERRALAGIDFAVERGAVHGFLGPNGSGKSTLFRILATLLPPSSGEVRVFGTDLVRDPGAVRPRLGVVFQSPALDKKLRVAENLRHGGHLYGRHGAGLERRLDEASTGLDPAARRELWRLLRSRSEVTVLFTTHLMDEAAEADRLTILDEGRVVAEGSPRELMREVGGQVLELEGSEPAELAAALAAAFEVEAVVLGDVIRVRSDAVHRLVPQVMDRFGARITRLTLSHPSLEDVFIARTGRRFEPQEVPA